MNGQAADDRTDDELPGPVKTVLIPLALGFLGAGVASALFVGAMLYLKAQRAGFLPVLAALVVFCVSIFAISIASARWGQRLSKTKPTAAAKRYVRRFLPIMGLYMVTLLVALFGRAYLKPTGVAAYALAVLPALPLVGAIAVIGLYLREETDEFERAMQVESSLWATGGLLAIATVWGFLETFGLAAHVEGWAAFPLWAALLGPARVLAARRYR